jgi:hypothetical protein
MPRERDGWGERKEDGRGGGRRRKSGGGRGRKREGEGGRKEINYYVCKDAEKLEL